MDFHFAVNVIRSSVQKTWAKIFKSGYDYLCHRLLTSVRNFRKLFGTNLQHRIK